MALCLATVFAVNAADALSGKFTININGDQVVFSKGNLQATTTDFGTNWTWIFAEHQWSFVGDAAANTSISENGTVSVNDTVDLFGWSTAITYYGINKSKTNNDYFGDFVEWGNNISEDWYTLNKEEWAYLFFGRTDAAHLFGMGSVNGVNGAILLPDNWAGAKFTDTDNGLTDKGASFYNNNGTNYSFHTFTAEQWSAMQANGAVFLPATGYRGGTDLYNVEGGYYWSSSPDDVYHAQYAYYVYFNPYLLNPQTSDLRSNGHSVRLVKAAPSGEKDIDQINDQMNKCGNEKLLHNGQIYSLRGDKSYTLQGQEME